MKHGAFCLSVTGSRAQFLLQPEVVTSVTCVVYHICWLRSLLYDCWWKDGQSVENDGGIFCLLVKLA